ncbi:class I SAM-dependent methyltransferase [Aspergillus tanneri]|uniref:Uncharacterized protein n=1 Tax=Aspergillus tanneri TaxID=1220188 RepID=A0A5M9MC71_9EURO|nr:uncharacterized protein ATNIH1004_009629 [Aspergillus tanneri]KAA8642874.1 hypothetical protein ATNIH1004_009629 [Aspergillus tanneri]
MEGYNSSYRAESYELAHTRHPWLNKDAPVYWEAYKLMRQLRRLKQSNSCRYIVVDIGTGTGRVIRHLTDRLTQEASSPKEVLFLGLDPSPYMLEHAQRSIPNTFKQSTFYYPVSALEMHTIDFLKGPPIVDLLVFAKGYISSLYMPGEVEEFLRLVSSVLRPHTGRVYLSLFHMSEEHNAEKASHTYREMTNSLITEEALSVIYPGVVYRQTKSDVKMEGGFQVVTSSLQVVERRRDGQERVIEKDTAVVKCRIWKKGEFIRVADMAGLDFIEAKGTDDETIYVFKTVG